MYNLLQDLSTLTTIGKYNLDILTNKSISIISHNIEESLRDMNNVTSIDIGLGILHIQHCNNEIRFKFIPSKKLETTVLDTCKNRESNLVLEIDKTLGERIQNTYKDLF